MERTASRPIELAFYGGTFTALPERLQMECLALAMPAACKRHRMPGPVFDAP